MKPRVKEARINHVARRRGRSTLAKAERGDFGERMFIWNIMRTRRRRVELLHRVRRDKGEGGEEVLEEVEVD
jgi:hypothetical protein